MKLFLNGVGVCITSIKRGLWVPEAAVTLGVVTAVAAVVALGVVATWWQWLMSVFYIGGW